MGALTGTPKNQELTKWLENDLFNTFSQKFGKYVQTYNTPNTSIHSYGHAEDDLMIPRKLQAKWTMEADQDSKERISYNISYKISIHVMALYTFAKCKTYCDTAQMPQDRCDLFWNDINVDWTLCPYTFQPVLRIIVVYTLKFQNLQLTV